MVKYNTEAGVKAVTEGVFKRYEKMYDDYQSEIDEFYSDERNAKYSYPYCIHGTSRWTDYDNICGGCEDGHIPNYWDAEHFRGVAEDEAKSICERMDKRLDALETLFMSANMNKEAWVTNEFLEFLKVKHQEIADEFLKEIGL